MERFLTVAGFSSSKFSSVAVALLALAGSAFAQDGVSKLPNGASSLQETYQDWSLACQSTPQAICTVSQQQTQQNGQRVMAIELRRNADGTLAGNLILPFGLALDAGVVLQIDDAAPQKPLRFSTCLPAGCLVSLGFDAKAVVALKTGTSLKVKVQGMDAKELTLPISLKGLPAAVDRLAALGSN
ncbi:invasion associated locus B family protein (plasmid) [Rhizobium sp. CB3090]|uniref:invasion associated locus B family protein n=1 Tax=Rhizobium sp. CB3090 TaxID=3039156 RepID=UPI0024B27B71|nr:invasion associated locus B family protein [Rhizobium sp. CB3090]WFU13313.1 invasion associated locus B family protein [Rhizobium sp. CB3090]